VPPWNAWLLINCKINWVLEVVWVNQECKVRGVFADPKAHVITLVRRSKKAFGEAVVDSSRAGAIDGQNNQLQTVGISNTMIRIYP